MTGPGEQHGRGGAGAAGTDDDDVGLEDPAVARAGGPGFPGSGGATTVRAGFG